MTKRETLSAYRRMDIIVFSCRSREADVAGNQKLQLLNNYFKNIIPVNFDVVLVKQNNFHLNMDVHTDMNTN